MADVLHGGDVKFLGYPFDMRGQATPSLLSTPFVRGGVLSNTVEETETVKTIYLDALNCKGFSGGPVLAQAIIGNALVPTIIGVVAGYLKDWQKLPTINENYFINSGLTACYPIELATALIANS